MGSPPQLTEIGLSTLDTRHLEKIAPGDRCQNWLPLIRSTHIRLVDNLHQPGDDHNKFCTWAHGDEFAFGRTNYKQSAGSRDLNRFLEDYFTNQELNKCRAGVKRNIILVTWAKHLEEQTIGELGLSWLAKCFRLYDFQRFPPAWACAKGRARATRTTNVQPVGLGHFAAALGVPTTLGNINLAHNGGNDAAFELQCFLAGCALTQSQLNVLERGGQLAPMEHASFAWVNVRGNMAESAEMYRRQQLTSPGWKYRKPGPSIKHPRRVAVPWK